MYPQHPHSPHQQPERAPMPPQIVPTPVVKVMSTLGLEYAFMTISLLVGVTGLIIALLQMVNGIFAFEFLALPVAMLVVNVPIFAGLFLRLKRLELHNPHLRLDPSKRRSTHIVQLLMFAVTMLAFIALVADLLGAVAGSESIPVGKMLLDVLATVVVSGGVLFYYWADEHKLLG